MFKMRPLLALLLLMVSGAAAGGGQPPAADPDGDGEEEQGKQPAAPPGGRIKKPSHKAAAAAAAAAAATNPRPAKARGGKKQAKAGAAPPNPPAPAAAPSSEDEEEDDAALRGLELEDYSASGDSSAEEESSDSPSPPPKPTKRPRTTGRAVSTAAPAPLRYKPAQFTPVNSDPLAVAAKRQALADQAKTQEELHQPLAAALREVAATKERAGGSKAMAKAAVNTLVAAATGVCQALDKANRLLGFQKIALDRGLDDQHLLHAYQQQFGGDTDLDPNMQKLLKAAGRSSASSMPAPAMHQHFSSGPTPPPGNPPMGMPPYGYSPGPPFAGGMPHLMNMPPPGHFLPPYHQPPPPPYPPPPPAPPGMGRGNRGRGGDYLNMASQPTPAPGSFAPYGRGGGR
jgi:hypothetical protein